MTRSMPSSLASRRDASKASSSLTWMTGGSAAGGRRGALDRRAPLPARVHRAGVPGGDAAVPAGLRGGPAGDRAVRAGRLPPAGGRDGGDGPVGGPPRPALVARAGALPPRPLGRQPAEAPAEVRLLPLRRRAQAVRRQPVRHDGGRPGAGGAPARLAGATGLGGAPEVPPADDARAGGAGRTAA